MNDLLDNDSDVDGDTLTVTTTPVSGPSNGQVTINSNGTFTYTPDENFFGADSFTYEVTDGNSGRAEATVDITVNPVNDAPSISLADVVNSLEENSNTTNSVRIANIVIDDDNLGFNDLSLSGTDASNFEIVGDELRIVAGATLDFESVSVFDVTVEVDDLTIGSTVEDSVDYTLNVIDVNESPTISLENVVQVFPGGIVLESGIKVADIVISDDALGTELLQLSGPDANLFEIVGNELFFNPGEGIDFNRETQSVLIQVDDPTLGQAFDGSVSLEIETNQLGIGILTETTPELEPEPEVEFEENTENDIMEMTEEDSDSTQLQEIVSTNPSQNAPSGNDPLDNTTATQELEQQANLVATVDLVELTDLIVQEASEEATSTFAFADYGALVQVVGGSDLLIPAVNQFAASISPLTINQFGEWVESNAPNSLVLERVVVGSSAIATTSLSVGYVIWMLRGGSLFASLITSIPAWSSFDLLPALNKFDEESLADIADK